MRVRDWQSIYVRPNGESMTITHSTREMAAENIASNLILCAKLAWQCDQTGHVAPLLKAAEDLVNSPSGAFLYVTPSGGKWILTEGV